MSWLPGGDLLTADRLRPRSREWEGPAFTHTCGFANFAKKRYL